MNLPVSKSKQKLPSRPVWWKNTFFWFAIALGVLGLLGLIRGDGAIRDPGQIREGGLAWMYFGGAVLMAINGFLTHRQSVKDYDDYIAGKGGS